MAAKRGAPRKRTRKEESLRIRVTSDQKELIQAAAARAGLTVSSWMIALAIERARAVVGK